MSDLTEVAGMLAQWARDVKSQSGTPFLPADWAIEVVAKLDDSERQRKEAEARIELLERVAEAARIYLHDIDHKGYHCDDPECQQLFNLRDKLAALGAGGEKV